MHCNDVTCGMGPAWKHSVYKREELRPKWREIYSLHGKTEEKKTNVNGQVDAENLKVSSCLMREYNLVTDNGATSECFLSYTMHYR